MNREERLNGIVFSDIKSLLLRNVKRLFLMGIACGFLFFFAVILVVLLAVLTPFTLILTIPLLFAFMVPLALMAPIYLFEDISLGEAFAKTFRLGFATWGGVFLILLVMGLIASVLQGIVSIPWYVIYIVKMIFTMSDGGHLFISRTELCAIFVLHPDVVWFLLVGYIQYRRLGLSVRSCIGSSGQHNGRK